MFSPSIKNTFALVALLSAAGCSGSAPVAAKDGPTAKADDALSFGVKLGSAIVAGSGCSEASSFITATDGRIDIDFTSLGVQLNPYESRTAGRSTCVIRIPITVPAGYYVSRVVQTLDYGVETTTGGTAAIAANTLLMGASVGGLTQRFPGDTDDYGQLHRSSAYAGSGSCSDAPQQGFLAVNIAMTAQKQDDFDAAIANVYAFSLDANQDIVLSQCGSSTSSGSDGSGSNPGGSDGSISSGDN
jgi:hypothetical protein